MGGRRNLLVFRRGVTNTLNVSAINCNFNIPGPMTMTHVSKVPKWKTNFYYNLLLCNSIHTSTNRNLRLPIYNSSDNLLQALIKLNMPSALSSCLGLISWWECVVRLTYHYNHYHHCHHYYHCHNCHWVIIIIMMGMMIMIHHDRILEVRGETQFCF